MNVVDGPGSPETPDPSGGVSVEGLRADITTLLSSGRPVLVVVGGAAGVGKSTLARQIATTTGLTVLDKDVLTGPFVNALCKTLTGDPEDRASQTYREQVRPIEYRVLMDTAWDALARGSRGVILDAPLGAEMNDPEWLADVAARGSGLGVGVRFIWAHCTEAENKARVVARGHARDAWKIAHWDEWAAALPSPPRWEMVTRIDTSAGAQTHWPHPPG